MARSRQAFDKASEEGAAQSDGSRCFSFCVGSFGPIAIDSELVTLGAEAAARERGDARVSCARGGDNGAAGVDSGAEAWSEDCQGTRLAHAGSRAPGHDAEWCREHGEATEVERTTEEGSVSVLAGGAASECTDVADVEQADKTTRVLGSGFESCFDAPSPQSPCAATGANGGRARGFRNLVGAARPVYGGNEEVMGVGDADRCPSMAMRAGSRVVGCPGLVVGMEEKEVELLFEQLWHIPQHLNKPAPRREGDIKTKPAARVRRSPPPPPLPPDRPRICYLGVEEAEVVDLELEEDTMADRGRGGRNRGRGTGGGRGDNWNRQQQNQQFQQNPQQQQQQFQDFQHNQNGFPFPPQPYGFVPGGMPPPWAFQGAYPQFPPHQFGFQSNQWIAPPTDDFTQNNQNQDGDGAGRGKGVQNKQVQKKKVTRTGEPAQVSENGAEAGGEAQVQLAWGRTADDHVLLDDLLYFEILLLLDMDACRCSDLMESRCCAISFYDLPMVPICA
ncbi:hypothetical protein ACQ4PT_060046 [Festuca glaucescens]